MAERYCLSFQWWEDCEMRHSCFKEEEFRKKYIWMYRHGQLSAECPVISSLKNTANSGKYC
jgi:hypothetical protein